MTTWQLWVLFELNWYQMHLRTSGCATWMCPRQNGARQITRLAIRVIACVNCVCFGAPIYIIIHGRRWGSKHLNQGHTTNWLRLLYQCKIIWDTPSFFLHEVDFLALEKLFQQFQLCTKRKTFYKGIENPMKHNFTACHTKNEPNKMLRIFWNYI